MKSKKVMAVILSCILSLSILTGCSDSSKPAATPSAEPTPEGYLYGVAGDMFREFVNNVAAKDMDLIKPVISINEETGIFNNDDLLQYLMSLKIGNLIDMGYFTNDVIVEESGERRKVIFKYQFETAEYGDSLTMHIKLIGTEWKVDLDEMLVSGTYLLLPPGCTATIDGRDLSVYPSEVDENGNIKIAMPAISKFEKKITVKTPSGKTVDLFGTFKPLSYNGNRIKDTGITVISPDMLPYEEPPVETTKEPEATGDIDTNEPEVSKDPVKEVDPIPSPSAMPGLVIGQ